MSGFLTEFTRCFQVAKFKRNAGISSICQTNTAADEKVQSLLLGETMYME
jgi:hypothetical protein